MSRAPGPPGRAGGAREPRDAALGLSYGIWERLEGVAPRVLCCEEPPTPAEELNRVRVWAGGGAAGRGWAWGQLSRDLAF